MDDNLRKYLDALSIQETGWDNKKTVGQNNVYNIKDFTGGGTRAYDRREGSNDAYRNFGSREEADNHIVGMLGRKYPGALEAKSIEEFTAALRQGGYASDPNHAKGIISIFNRKYGQQGPEAAPVAQSPTMDFSSFEHKYGDKIKTARAQGVADADIARTIDFYENQEKTTATVRANIEAGRPQAEREVAVRVARSGSPIDGVAYLGTLPGFKEEVAYARSIGKTDEEIIQKLAPGGMVGLQAYQKRKGTSAIQDLGEGILDQLESYSLGTRQLLTFDPARERELLAEEQARRMDPNRIALNNTVGGMVGGVLPDVAAGVLTGGLGAPATIAGRLGLAAAGGAVSGAMNPIVDGESRTNNALVGAALSGATSGIVDNVIKYAPKVSDKVRDAIKQREVPLQDDIRARVVSQRLAYGQGVDLTPGTPHIDMNWIARTGEKLSKEYDELLDGHTFVLPDAYRAQLEDVNFRKNFTSGELDDIDQLLYETVNQKRMVPKQMLNPDGTVRMEPTQKIVRDADGRPMREDYSVQKTYDQPRTETTYVPKTEYQQKPNQMKLAQVIGDDGNVLTNTRRRVAYLPDGSLPEANLRITTYKDGDKTYKRTNLVRPTEPYEVPKMEYQQFPGNSVRTQVRDADGKVIMEPRLSKVRDETGAVIMDQVERTLKKSRTKMERRMVPSSEYVQVEVPVKVPRQNPMPLRDAHNLMKNVKGKFAQLTQADYVDSFKRDAFERLKDLVEDAYYAGSSANIDKMKNLDQRYAKYSIAKEVFAKADAEGHSLGDVKHWESVMKKNRYSPAFIRGESPVKDIVQGLQENTRELERVARGDKAINELSNIGATAGFATGSPLLGAIAGGARLLGKAVNQYRSNPDKGLDLVLSSQRRYPQELEDIKKLAKEQYPTNVERRVKDTGGTKRAGDGKSAKDETIKVLKRALERRPIPVVSDGETDE